MSVFSEWAGRAGVRVADTSEMVKDCLVCAELSGEVEVPGGFLERGPLMTVFHSPVLPAQRDVYVGHLLVAANRHIGGFSGLSDPEAAAVGVAIARWSRQLESLGAEHVYVLRVGHGAPHLHVNLVPRWPGTPADMPWTDVDSWPGARRESADGAASLVHELRALDD